MTATDVYAWLAGIGSRGMSGLLDRIAQKRPSGKYAVTGTLAAAEWSRTATLEEAMRRAGFAQDADGAQPKPGIWLRRDGNEPDGVDLMAPE